MLLSLVLAGLLGYFLGSIPIAYLLVRWKSNIDIRNAGSGNVGTLNSFEVTRSKMVGVLVLIFDLLKGALAVLLGYWLIGPEFRFGATAGLFAVLGHNFPVWLRFKGGRGLASAAGVMFVFDWIFVAAWGIMWVVGFFAWRKVNLGNTFATLCLFIALLVLPGEVLGNALPSGIPVIEFRGFGMLLMAIILVRHIDPVRQHMVQKKLSRETIHQG